MATSWMLLKIWCFTVPLKVSDYFLQGKSIFWQAKYLLIFAILPVRWNNNPLGTIVIELTSKPLQSFASFPDLLIEGQTNLEDEFKDYSYAFYSDNKLVGQSGNYVYNLKNTDLQGQLNKYVTKNTKNSRKEWYSFFTSYNHLNL